jgi:hypothetical protein
MTYQYSQSKSQSVATLSKAFAGVTLSLVLAACGGNKSDDAPTSVPAGIGQVKGAVFIKTIAAADIAKALPAGFAPTVVPRYDVDTYKITYTTIDVNGNLIQASGLGAFPRKAAGAVSPILSYQHPTITLDAQAPSNHATADEPTVVYASLGYLVSAPDYVGYGSSKGAGHPYLQALPSAAAVNDLLAASAQWRQSQQIKDNGQVFLTGYSEGAYASLASLRLYTQNKAATASLPVLTYVGAGPYDVVGTLDFLLDVSLRSNPILTTLVTPGSLKLLSNDNRVKVRNSVLSAALGDQRDVEFDPRFLDNYLNDDTASIVAQSNVYDWTPQSRITFFHGRDDTTVPYASTDIAVKTMSARGAGGLLERVDCTAVPADHLNCAPSYFINSVARMAAVAQGL